MSTFPNSTLFKRFYANPPASPVAIKHLQAQLNFTLPADYVAYLLKANGGEGFIGDPSYVVLWPVEDLIEANLGYEVAEWVPGLFLFGSDGGGVAFAFDTRSPACAIVMVPFIPMEFKELVPIAPNFESFLQKASDPNISITDIPQR
jgi:hypothetical protein